MKCSFFTVVIVFVSAALVMVGCGSDSSDRPDFVDTLTDTTTNADTGSGSEVDSQSESEEDTGSESQSSSVEDTESESESTTVDTGVAADCESLDPCDMSPCDDITDSCILIDVCNGEAFCATYDEACLIQCGSITNCTIGESFPASITCG